MAANQTQGSEPRLSSFGLADQGKEFPTDPGVVTDTKRKRPQERDQRNTRTAAVSKRQTQEQDEPDSGDDDELERVEGDDLEASGDDSDNLESEDLNDGDGEDDTNDGGEGDDSREAGDADRKNNKADSRSRKQLRKALEEEADKRAELQRQVDRLTARMDSGQQRQESGDGDGEDDGDLDALLDDGKADTELLSKADLKARADRKKKLSAHIGKAAGARVKAYHDGELQALYAMPGVKEVVAWAEKNGDLKKITAEMQHPATKAVALLQAKHKADTERLKAQHNQEIGKLKNRLRQNSLDEIPPNEGSRGGAGTGRGSAGNKSPVAKGYEDWKRKFAS